MNHSAAYPTILQFLVLVVVAMLVVSIIRKHPRVGLAVVLCGAVLFGLIFLTPRATHVYVSNDNAPVIHADEELSRVIQNAERDHPQVAWKPEVNELFDADRYPTKRLAVDATGRHTKSLIKKIVSSKWVDEVAIEKPCSIIIHGASHHAVPDDLLTDIGGRIKTAMPHANVTVKHGDHIKPGEPSAPAITEDDEYRVAVRPNGNTPDRAIKLTAYSKKGSASETIQYDDDSEWAMTPVAAPPFLRIRTPEFCLDRHEAKQNALDEAAKHLTTLSTKLPIYWHRPIEIEEEVRKRADQVVAKRFTQKLTNKRGESFYRSAVDLNLHEAVVMLHSLAGDESSYSSATYTDTNSRSIPVRSIAGLLAAVMGICILLNFVTRAPTQNRDEAKHASY